MADSFDPTQFGAVAVDEPPQQESFDPTKHGAIPVQEAQPQQQSGFQQTIEKGLGIAGDIASLAYKPPSVLLNELAFPEQQWQKKPLISAPTLTEVVHGLQTPERAILRGAFGETGQRLSDFAGQFIGEQLSGATTPENLALLVAGGRLGKVPKLSEVAGITKPETPLQAAEAPVPGVEAPIPQNVPQPPLPTTVSAGEQLGAQFQDLQTQAADIQARINEQRGAPYAIQEPSAGTILQRQPEETGATGGERGRVEPSVQGQETPEARQGPEAGTQEAANVAPVPAAEAAKLPLGLEEPKAAAVPLGTGGAVVTDETGNPIRSATELRPQVKVPETPELREDIERAKYILEHNPIRVDDVGLYSGKEVAPNPNKQPHGYSQEVWKQAWNESNKVSIRGKLLKSGAGDASTYETIFQGKPTDYAPSIPEVKPGTTASSIQKTEEIGAPKEEAPTAPISQQQPNSIPTPAEHSAFQGEGDKIGIAERYREEQQPGSVIPGIGRTADEARAWGHDFINKGNNPYDVINNKGPKRELWQDVGVVRAEYERLSNEKRTAESALEADPSNPQLQMAFDNADLAQRKWSQDAQPVLTGAGDALRAASRSYPREINTFSDFTDIVNDLYKGQIELTPEKRAEMQKMLKAIRTGNETANATRAAVTDAAVKKAGGRVMSFQDLKNDLTATMEKLLENCPS